MITYLQEVEKEATLKYLRERYKEATLYPDGYLDLEMIPYLERINACKGVVTLQSCTGHRKTEEHDHTHEGHLWVKLSKKVAMLCDKQLVVLVRSPLVYEIDKKYSYPYKEKRLQEIMVIRFKGHEEDSFHKSMEFIVKFFERLK